MKFATFTETEEKAVVRIVSRAADEFDIDRLDLRMDLSCIHSHTPLRLAELAEADGLNFSHDILGIRNRLDRETGELVGFFRPRFAA